MQRSIIAKAIACIPSRNRVHQPVMMGLNQRSCDVFINHRGADTKRTISGLLYNHLYSMGFSPFLDSKNMKPGDNLYDNINKAIKDCKVGVAVFSPRYTESYFCLHELSLMMESKKKVIPVFCDIKPSELLQPMGQYGGFTAAEVHRFHRALEEARYTVGITFDTLTGDWSEFLMKATDVIVEGLLEVEENRRKSHVNYQA